jgi:hypothetical protein
MDQRGLFVLLHSERGAVWQDTERKVRRIEAKAKRKVGVDTGRLRSRIFSEVSRRGASPVGRVGADVEYALVHHEGHGPIVPVRAKVLMFTPKGSRKPVFTTHVRAVPPNRYLTDSLDEVIVENV